MDGFSSVEPYLVYLMYGLFGHARWQYAARLRSHARIASLLLLHGWRGLHCSHGGQLFPLSPLDSPSISDVFAHQATRGT